MTNPSSLPAERFSNTLEELRASVVAGGASGGLAGKVQRALLRLLDALVTLLAELKASRLAEASHPGAGVPGPAPQPYSADDPRSGGEAEERPTQGFTARRRDGGTCGAARAACATNAPCAAGAVAGADGAAVAPRHPLAVPAKRSSDRRAWGRITRPSAFVAVGSIQVPRLRVSGACVLDRIRKIGNLAGGLSLVHFVTISTRYLIVA